MRDRLIGIVKSSLMMHIGKSCNFAENIVDDLLNENVIVLPCKVGDTVYYVHETYWDEDYENYITTEKYKQSILQVVDRPNHETNLMLEIKEFDYTLIDDYLKGDIFLTREEAEQALAERKGV